MGLGDAWKRKRETEGGLIINDHYHSVIFAVKKSIVIVDSRVVERCICKGVLWGSLSI